LCFIPFFISVLTSPEAIFNPSRALKPFLSDFYHKFDHAGPGNRHPGGIADIHFRFVASFCIPSSILDVQFAAPSISEFLRGIWDSTELMKITGGSHKINVAGNKTEHMDKRFWKGYI